MNDACQRDLMVVGEFEPDRGGPLRCQVFHQRCGMGEGGSGRMSVILRGEARAI